MWRAEPRCFADLPGWRNDDHGAALAAFVRHVRRGAPEIYRTGSFGIAPESLARCQEQAAGGGAQRDPRGFFECHFRPVAIVPDSGIGRVTAYYEPEIEASRTRTSRFSVPFYRRPADLVAIGHDNRPPGWDPDIRFGQQDADGVISHYPDRAAINAGYLEGRELELAWVEDPVDAFFAHIQGAARLLMPDGSVMRVTYDGKSGHAFTGIGAALIERGEIAPDEVGMASIRAWLADDPDAGRTLMEENRSYIFFREAPVSDPDDGPVAAAKVPLTAGRSLAVDRLIHTFGTPVYMCADNVNGTGWSRLMIAQDTGSAIVGPARGDLFMGSGCRAGDIAGNVNSRAAFFVLVPGDTVVSDGPVP
jgi:membrane-bound lytic murein transglycosylase A